jgi:hypothetical protein
MKIIAICSLSAMMLAGGVFAQEMPEATPQHKWLQKFEGEWETETVADMGSGQPKSKGTGTIKSEMLGKFWVINDMTAEMGAFKVSGRQTIGYDKATEKYVGTWVDSMSDFIWQYDGSVDETGKILTLEAKGPDMFQPGKMALYRDIYNFVSEDEVKLTSTMQGPDGKWIDFMTGVSKRKK